MNRGWKVVFRSRPAFWLRSTFSAYFKRSTITNSSCSVSWPRKPFWNAANFYEAMAFIEAYRCRILRIHRKLQLQDTVISCMLCNLVQKVCGNPGSALAFSHIHADKPRAMRHFPRTLKPEPHHADGLSTQECDKHRLIQMLAPIAFGEMDPITEYTRKRKRSCESASRRMRRKTSTSLTDRRLITDPPSIDTSTSTSS